MFRLSADLQGTISKPWFWNVGIGLLHYDVGSVDVAALNKYAKNDDDKLPENVATLYDRYVSLNYITEEANGGIHPYLHGGITFDTRDRQQNPRRGIHADAFVTYYRNIINYDGPTQPFQGSCIVYGNSQRNDLKFNASWRHYVPIVPNRLTFAYRLGTQLNLAGGSPFYLDSYLNQLYMQRVIYEGLGGANSLRGILRNRIVAPGVAFANVEFRVQVVHFKIGKENFYIGLNPFMDAGMVVQPYPWCVKYDMEDPESNFDDSRLYAPHLSAGCGLKVAMNDNFVLSVDWATALDKQDNAKFSNLYIKMGYMF